MAWRSLAPGGGPEESSHDAHRKSRLTTTTVRIWKGEHRPIAQQGQELDVTGAFIIEFADKHKDFRFPELWEAVRGSPEVIVRQETS